MIKFHVYDETGRYIGGTVYASDAAALVSSVGEGATVSAAPPTVDPDIYERNVLWREGFEEIPASESYDIAAGIMLSRARALRG